jgi:hypothetical protein
LGDGSRRFAAVIIVVLVILAGLTGALLYILPELGTESPDFGEDEGEGWYWDSDGYMVVEEDVTWTGRSYVLDHHLVIVDEARFTLEDCIIEVPYESLMFEEIDRIQIRSGSVLELLETEIIVTSEPELDEAWICSPTWNDYELSYMARVLDLREATRPTLEFDARFLIGTSILVVGAQQSPGEDLEPLAVLDPQNDSIEGWEHVSIPLDTYIGGTPRLVLFVQNATREDVLISGLTITDNGGPLANNILWTGDEVNRGWNEDGFKYLWDRMENHRGRHPFLIDVDGRLVVRDSRIKGVPGLQRNSGSYWTHRTMVNMWLESNILVSTSRDLAINSSGGSLLMRDSNISFTPVIVDYSEVDIQRTEFLGDDELLTVNGSSGNVLDCHFTTVELDKTKGGSGFDEPLWHLAVEGVGPDGPLLVRGCSFNGVKDTVGIHLIAAEVDIRDLRLDGLRIGVWNHGSGNIGWDMLGTLGVSITSCRIHYLETTVVDIHHPRPDGYQRDRYGSWSRVSLPEGPSLWVELRQFELDNNTLACLPSLVVTEDGMAEPITSIVVNIRPNWVYENDDVVIDPRLDWVDVDTDDWVYDYGTYEDRYGYVEINNRLSNITGEVHQVITVEYLTEELSGPFLRIFLDGEFVEEIPTNQSIEANEWGDIRFKRNQSIDTGSHQLSVYLWGDHITEGRMEMANATCFYYRASVDAVVPEALDVLDYQDAAILVDPGVRLEGLEYQNESDERGYSILSILLGHGASISIDSIRMPEWTWVEIYVEGNGEASFKGIRGMVGDIFSNLADMSWEDIDASHLSGGVNSSSLTMKGRLSINDSWLDIIDGDLIIEDAHADRNYDLNMIVYNSSVRISDSIFDGRRTEEVTALMLENSSLDVERCTFTNMTLETRFYTGNSSVNITDSSFAGRGAYIYLVGRFRDDSYLRGFVEDDIPYLPPSVLTSKIERNSFDGRQSGFLFDPAYLEGEMDDNSFVNGALALTYFMPAVSYDLPKNGTVWYNATSWTSFLLLEEYYYVGGLGWERFRFMVDVTDDLDGALDLSSMPVIFTQTGWGIGRHHNVVGFGTYDTTVDHAFFHIPRWEPIDVLIMGLVAQLTKEGNWWTEG